jgi:hypothetical protein
MTDHNGVAHADRRPELVSVDRGAGHDLFPSRPPPVRLNPLPASRLWIRARQIQYRDPLSRLSTHTHGDDPLVIGQVDALDGGLHSQHVYGEGYGEMLLEHGVEPARLLGFVVGVDDGLLDVRRAWLSTRL